ncbi:MAG TPA: ABC transporter ATP-binding protein [Hyphomicrobiaceae bacterium]|nr:ABC transporter ATP-binding protein [Hyphomicrobiaceae bacterium]
MSLLQVEGLAIHFGGLAAVDDLSFEVPPGRIYSIIGPNGAGKTTLFNMISGVYHAGSGRIRFAGQDVTGLEPHRLARLGLSRTFQNLQIFFRLTALENVMVGRHLHEPKGILAHALRLPSVRRANRDCAAKAHDLLKFVGLGPDAERIAGGLPYGALKRLEIARALASEPRLLLLDEPAAGCNPVETEAIDGLIQQIARQGITVALVEHDMKLVMKISDRILVLDRGRRLAEGSAAEVRANPDVVRAYLGSHGTAAARAGDAR